MKALRSFQTNASDLLFELTSPVRFVPAEPQLEPKLKPETYYQSSGIPSVATKKALAKICFTSYSATDQIKARQ